MTDTQNCPTDCECDWCRLARLSQENERLKRMLWLIVYTNGGYTLEYQEFQDYPGDERAVLIQEPTPQKGDVHFRAEIVNGPTGSDR